MSDITALAPWFGSKRTLGPEIVAEIGPHTAYWEPFCGSMAVLLAKPPCRTEIVNDLHGDLVNLARVIQHPALGPALYRRLRRVWSSEDLFRDSIAVIKSADLEVETEPDVDRAFHYFITSWQGMNGVAGCQTTNTGFARRFSTKGGDTGARWANTVRSIPAWRRRLERVQILNCDAFELLEKIADQAGTAIYCDPPYLTKGAKYLHDFSAADHSRLASVLGRFKECRVVVSYYADPRLASLYPGWRTVNLEVAKAMVQSGKRVQKGATSAPEVLLVNALAADQPLFDFESAAVAS
jgi:DNA adenine methylase